MLQPYRATKMKNLLFAVLTLATTLLMNSANAGGCATNNMGQVVCAPPGGGAAVNNMGQVVTGRGGCARNNMGQVVCSDTPGGGAAINNMGQVVARGHRREGRRPDLPADRLALHPLYRAGNAGSRLHLRA